MAEFCLECYNKMNHTNLTEKDIDGFVMDLCEGCGEIKMTIIKVKYRPKYSFLKSLLLFILTGRFYYH